MIEFTPAVGADDWCDLMALRTIAEYTMRKSGLYTEQQLTSGEEELWRRFERGTMYIARDHGVVLGALGLDEPNPDLWDDPSREALYLYKVMAIPGHGIGDELVEFAVRVATELGRRYLRLDCLRGNAALQTYWKSQGFEHLRDVTIDGYGAGALFEREIR
jgi:GNAT superfamily N-acetyltransferase